jgi:hypothetical protein
LKASIFSSFTTGTTTADLKPGQIGETMDGGLVLCVETDSKARMRILLSGSRGASVSGNVESAAVNIPLKRILSHGSQVVITVEE